MNFDKIINRIGTYSTQWDYVQDRFGKAGLLPFTISDMDLQTSPEILQNLEHKVKHGIFGYTRWDHDDYKGAITHWYQERFHTPIKPQWIAYAPAIIYAITKLLHIIDPQKQGVCLIAPCYDGFIKILTNNQYPINTVPMDNDLINWDYFEQQLSKSKILLLCNPNNPNGHLWSEEELHKIVQLCKQYNVSILSDDIHMDFVYKPHQFIPITKIAESYDYLEQTTIITSSSKTFNLSGLGGAYIICPNQQIKNTYLTILKEIDSLGSAMSLHIDSLITGYHQSNLWVDSLCSYLHKNLQTVHDFLSLNIPDFNLKIPNATYFAWIDCQNTNLSISEIQHNLVHKGEVAIMDSDRYCEPRPFLRMNIACPNSKVIDGLERIKQSL